MSSPHSTAKSKKFYITTPIYYVNARPHVGHAYTTIVADVLARRHRLLGEDTFFLTGTDEHGQKIERSAAAAGVPPQQFADGVSASFESLWKRMGITNDRFIRTTDEAHKRGVQQLFNALYERGFIYLSSYTGQYSVGEEMFVEGPPGTLGPDGKPTETLTEENFFFKLSAFQRPLLNLIESGTLKVEPEARRNEVLSFLRGNTDRAPQTSVISTAAQRSAETPLFPAASATSTSANPIAQTTLGTPYVPGALKDLSISRSSFTWGVPVPELALRHAGAKDKHVIYVWLDALANYMTAVGYGDHTAEAQAEFARWWPADLHLVGKEIIRFHCVYWPAFLLALNDKLQHDSDEPPPTLPFTDHAEWAHNWLPKAITAHGWLLFDNSKMSKSKGNIVRTETILDAFGTLCPALVAEKAGIGSSGLQPAESDILVPGASAPEVRTPTPHERDLFATDVLRYFLLREIPFGQDGSFSFEAMVTRYNADLANGYGNLVSRVINLLIQNLESVVPDFASAEEERVSNLNTSLGGHTAYMLQKTYDSYATDASISTMALAAPMELITGVDRFISDNEPWKLAKAQDDVSRRRLEAVLYIAAESIRIITALLYPILPFATARVWAQLGLGDIEQAAANGELRNLQWGDLKPGTKLGPLSPIFPRADSSADKGLAHIMTDMEDEKNTPAETTDPAAPPRAIDPLNSLDEPTGTLPVAGSTALTTERPSTPPHTEAASSGLFAGRPQPIPGAPSSPRESGGGAKVGDAAPEDVSQNPQITIDDFAKVEMRVAQILVAERIPKADKLLRLEVDLGPDFPARRQILSGIAEWYTPEELLGRRIVVITNLAPRKMRGLESHGMLLAASEGDGGKPILATFGEDIALGSRLR